MIEWIPSHTASAGSGTGCEDLDVPLQVDEIELASFSVDTCERR